jgi:DNA-binding IclR family transcriptional regulator
MTMTPRLCERIDAAIQRVSWPATTHDVSEALGLNYRQAHRVLLKMVEYGLAHDEPNVNYRRWRCTTMYTYTGGSPWAASPVRGGVLHELTEAYEPLTTQQLVRNTGAHVRTIRRALCELERLGKAMRVTEQSAHTHLWVAT